jgi:predicted RNase H-like nuclease (RuvC/YqgF family)
VWCCDDNRVLREVRQSLESECVELKRTLSAKETELSSLQRDMNDVHTSKDREMSQLAAELKVKAFEVTALGVTFEVSATLLST